MKVTLITHTPDPQRLIETCARISYESKNEPFDQKVNSEFIRKLIRNGHESPLEHASATFLIEGVSRACSHQIVRHRLCSYTQRSSRYTKFDPDKNTFVWPSSVKNGGQKAIIAANCALSTAHDCYNALIDAGVPKEDARFFLPQAEATSLYMTANFREWRHFLKLRLDRHAQWEIRAVACKIYEKLSEIAQDVFEDLASEYQSNFVAGG